MFLVQFLYDLHENIHEPRGGEGRGGEGRGVGGRGGNRSGRGGEETEGRRNNGK